MKKLLFLFVILVLGQNTSGQTSLDSMWFVWENTENHDTLRLQALKSFTWDKYLFNHPDSAFQFAQLMYDYADQKQLAIYAVQALNIQGISFMIQSNYEKAIEYYEQCLVISDKINNKRGMADAYSNIGSCYRNIGNYSQALQYDMKSLALENELENKKGIAQSLNNIGIVQRLRGDYPSALDYYSKSLKIKEELGDKKGVANTLNNIGIIYRIQENYPSALEYYFKSIAIKETIDDIKGIGQSQNNIGGIYFLQKKYDKAEDYFKRSISIKKSLGDKSGLARVTGNLGVLYDQIGNHSKAVELHYRGLELRKEISDKQGIAESMTNIGESYRLYGQAEKGIQWCRESLNIAEKINAVGEQQVACNCLFESYKALSQGMKALEFYEKSHKLLDSLKSEETGMKLQQIEFAKQLVADSLRFAKKEYETKLKHHAELHKEERIKNISVLAGVFVLLLSFGLWSRLKYIRKTNKKIRKEKDKSESLLLNILPFEIAEELKEHGRSAARKFNMVSILFTDFKGFTKSSEVMSAEELVSEINVCFEAFDHICDKYNIEKIKTIGDAYMAAGGLPIPHEESVKNTVFAALDMVDFIEQRKKDRNEQGKIPFEMRVGINTGPVVAGIVGVKKFQYDVWGDTVNTASRMESHGEVGAVNISQKTFNSIKSDPLFNFIHRGKISAKGKGEIDMYFVTRV